jgi:glutathione S-transferase
MMKLYMHPASTMSRPVRLLIAEHELPVSEQLVDLLAGEQRTEAYGALNPNGLVPMLEDGDFRLTESSAILKYLAAKFELAVYPRDLRRRARVDEAMDWFNSQFLRDFGHNLVFPQVIPHHRRPTEELNAGTIAWGKTRSRVWLGVLDTHYLGRSRYVAGDTITIADYFGGSIVSAGHMIGLTFEAYPNIERWLGAMTELSTWVSVNEPMQAIARLLKDRRFEW